jgi:DNA-binding GntR family transcriptional regulator
MADRKRGERGRPRSVSDISLRDVRTLDRASVVPLYFQLAAALLERLDTGAWAPGARFPSEREIAEAFGVSRAVIRPALELLVGDGAIVREQGRGAFVAEPRRQIPLFSLIEALLSPREDLGISILTAVERRPDAAVSHFLEMKTPAPIAHVTGVVNLEGQAIGLIDSRSSRSLVPWLLPTAQAIQRQLEPPPAGELELTRAPALVEHTFFGRWGGSTVGTAAGEPALMGRLVQYGRLRGRKRERALEFTRLVYRGDSVQLIVDGG